MLDAGRLVEGEFETGTFYCALLYRGGLERVILDQRTVEDGKID